jgi:hypothetical protein
MPSYQIPQFLDSGDAIFLWMNMRQFAFALFGFLFCFLIYTLLSGPSLELFGVSWYAVIPVIPIGLVAAYLSSGSYNGRPSEVYLYKIIIYLLKPRIYIFQRVPDLTDLNQKQALWLESSIETRLNKNLELDKDEAKDEFTEFSSSSRTQKANNVRSLGQILDLSGSEANADIYKKSQFATNIQKMIKGEQVQVQEDIAENSENFFDQKTN